MAPGQHLRDKPQHCQLVVGHEAEDLDTMRGFFS
jgi:hypothetical protein